MTTPDFIDLDGEGEQPTPPAAPIPPEVIGQGADLERRQRPKPTPPDRSPPHSAEAEEHVLACCMLDGDGGATIERAIASGLTPESFYLPQNRLAFEACAWLARNGTNPTLETVAAELSSRRLLDQVGGFPYLMQVTGKIPTTAHAGYFIEKVREKAVLREVIRSATQTVEDAYNFTDDLPEFLSLARARLDTIQPPAITTVAAHLDARRVRLTTPPPEPKTRLYLAGKPIATPGNLVTVIAKSKTGKTAALGAATAAIIAAHYDQPNQDTFKFTAPHTNEAVILIDTEQSPYDAWTCHSRTMARAGNPAEPEWLHHYAMVGDSAADLRKALPVALERGKQLHKGVFAVILDGVADFVTSVNDEAECNGFVAYLHGLAVTYDCPIICVIHSNEGIKTGDDGRGHLGKQLTRKAESNLLLKKVGDVTTITSEKQRKAPITEKDEVAFKWDETVGRHVSCKAPDLIKGGRPSTCSFSDFESIFPREPEKAMTKEALRRYAVDIAPVSETTFRTILAEACEKGWLTRIPKAHGFVYYIP